MMEPWNLPPAPGRVPVAHLLDRKIGPDEVREPGAAKLPPRKSPRYAAVRLGESRDREGDVTLYLDDPAGNGSLTLDLDEDSLAAVRAALREPVTATQVLGYLDMIWVTLAEHPASAPHGSRAAVRRVMDVIRALEQS
jgi:hypothetical protein